jgi:hypothetical protein
MSNFQLTYELPTTTILPSGGAALAVPRAGPAAAYTSSLKMAARHAGYKYPFRHPPPSGIVEKSLSSVGGLLRSLGAALDEYGAMIVGTKSHETRELPPWSPLGRCRWRAGTWEQREGGGGGRGRGLGFPLVCVLAVSRSHCWARLRWKWQHTSGGGPCELVPMRLATRAARGRPGVRMSRERCPANTTPPLPHRPPSAQPNLAWTPIKLDPASPPTRGQVTSLPQTGFVPEGLKKLVMPVKADNVFIAPSANVIGDVKIGANSSVWYGACLRGERPCCSGGWAWGLQAGVGGVEWHAGVAVPLHGVP